jgi:hypothetical protein
MKGAHDAKRRTEKQRDSQRSKETRREAKRRTEKHREAKRSTHPSTTGAHSMASASSTLPPSKMRARIPGPALPMRGLLVPPSEQQREDPQNNVSCWHVQPLARPCEHHLQGVNSPCEHHLQPLARPCEHHLQPLARPCEHHLQGVNITCGAKPDSRLKVRRWSRKPRRRRDTPAASSPARMACAAGSARRHSMVRFPSPWVVLHRVSSLNVCPNDTFWVR